MLIYKIKLYFLKFIFLIIKNKKLKTEIIESILGKQISGQYIYQYWLFNNTNDVLIATCSQYYNKLGQVEWLIYATILMEYKLYKKLNLILKEYIKKYNDSLIDTFIPLSFYCKNNNIINNENIEKSALIFETLEKNRKNKIFKKLIKNKTIAIVGNSDCALGEGKGNEIDSHDLVIRFNNYRIKEFHNDYGSKTNIWLSNNASDIIVRNNDYIEKLNMLITGVDIWHNIMSNNIRDMLFNYIISLKISVCYIESDVRDYLRKNIKIKNPTSGIILFYYIHKILKKDIKDIDLYGFSFLQEDKNKYQHYYEEIESELAQKVIDEHDMHKQNEYFIKILRNKK